MAFEWFKKIFKKPEAKVGVLSEPTESEYQSHYSEARAEATDYAEQLKREQEARRKVEEELRKSKKKPKYGKEKADFAWGFFEYARATVPGFDTMPPEVQRQKMEELTRNIPPEQAERISKQYREAAETSAESGIPLTRTEYTKTWVPGHYVDSATGKTVPAGTPGAEYKPGEYAFKQIPIRRSPAELKAEAAILKGGIAEMEERYELAQGRKRERKLAPIKAVGSALGSSVAAVGAAGVSLLGEGTRGVAVGAQRGLAPGRGGPQRAQGILTPRMSSAELFRVRAPQIDLSGLRGGPRPQVGPNLSYLRSSGPSLGHLRSSIQPVRMPATSGGKPTTPNLEGIRGQIRKTYPKKLRLW